MTVPLLQEITSQSQGEEDDGFQDSKLGGLPKICLILSRILCSSILVAGEIASKGIKRLVKARSRRECCNFDIIV